MREPTVRSEGEGEEACVIRERERDETNVQEELQAVLRERGVLSVCPKRERGRNQSQREARE